MRSDDLEQLIRGLPDTRQELLATARSLDIEGRSQTAVDLLEEAVRRAPSQPLRKALAALYQNVGRPAECASALEAVLEREPGDIPSLMLLAEAQVEAGELDGARKSLARAETLGASRTGIMQVRRKLERVSESNASAPSPNNSSGGPPPMPPPLPGDASSNEEPQTEEMPSPTLDASPTDSGLESVESSIFEDGTFSNLSSQSLAEGAAALEENEESSVFDTLVNHEYEDDDPDRSFDALLSTLGVPVEATPTVDERDETIDRSADSKLIEDAAAGNMPQEAMPDEKTAAVDLDSLEQGSLAEDSVASDETPEQPFEDEAPTQISQDAPGDETTDPIASPSPLVQDAPAPQSDAAPMDEAPTDLSAPVSGGGAGLASDSSAADMPEDEFPDELPTQIEPEQKRKRRRATQRHKALSRDEAGINEARPANANEHPTAEDRPPGRLRQQSGGQPAQGKNRDANRSDQRPPSSGRNEQPERSRHPSGQRDAVQRPSGSHEQVSRRQNRPSGEHRAPNPSAGRSSRRGGSPFDQGNVPAPSRPSSRPSSSDESPFDKARVRAKDIWRKLSDKLPGSTLLVAVPVVVVILIGTLLGVGAWAMSSLGDNIEDGLREARRQQRVDTYEGYLDAGQTLASTANATSFAGSTFDAFVEGIGMTSSRVESNRASAAAELALVTAMLEYRYERLDARDSLERIELAESLAASDPRIAAARAYRLMTEGAHQKAREVLSAASVDYPRSKDIAAALIELELETGHPDAAHKAATLFRDTEQYDVYPKFLLGRIEYARGKSTAEDVFRRILRDSSPEHLWARVEQSYAVRMDDPSSNLGDARDLVDPILGKFSERASALQKARAHIALGDTYAISGPRKKANTHYAEAREIAPSRAVAHLALIDFYLDDGRTEEALEAIETATEQAGASAAVSLRRARAHYQQGQFENVIETIDSMSAPGADAHSLAAHARLALGDPDAAVKSFDAAAKSGGPASATLAAYTLAARAMAADELDEGWRDEAQTLVDESRDAPEVLRAQGLLLMEFAEAETGYREQRELFEEATESFSKAAEQREDWYLIEYDLCRARMRSGDGSNAFAHCKRGRKLNANHRPGVITAIQLAILRGGYDDATAISTELSEAFPDAPDVSFARIRAMVAQREIDAAEEQINRWAGEPVAESHAAKMAEGLLAFRKNDFRSALGYFQRAHEAAPRDVEAAVYYAWTAARLGQDDGEDILGNRLSDPLWGPRAWHALGELRLSQGELRDARENFAEALEDYRDGIAPEWRESESYAELARAWARERGWNYGLTRRYVSRSMTRGDKDSVPAHMVNGEYDLEKRRRERDKAAEHFERVLAREPFNCEAIDYLLDIYDDLGLDDDEKRIKELDDKYCD